MNIVRASFLLLLKFLRKLLASSPRLRALLYDMRNKDEFGNLYEHEKMLADSVRIDHYRKAIEKYVGSEDVILDLGTGTGILSFFAARQNPKKIYAIDHSDFIDVARCIATHNNIVNIEFEQCNSRNFNPGVKFDVIIHEQMGDYLFNENMVQNLLDLKCRLLKPEGKIIPGKFELYLEPASLAETFNVPFIWDNHNHDIDFGFLKNLKILEDYKPAEYVQQWLEANAVKCFTCTAEPVLSFDLNELYSEKAIPHSIEISKKIRTQSSIDGFCLFFKAIFDDEINFDTSPLSTNTHWGNCFFRIESRTHAVGEIINYQLTMPDLLNIKTWSVEINNH